MRLQILKDFYSKVRLECDSSKLREYLQDSVHWMKTTPKAAEVQQILRVKQIPIENSASKGH